MYDVKAHFDTAGHKESVEKTKTYCHFKIKKPELEGSTQESEVLFCQFVAEHNLPAAIADHFTDLIPRMFPDSKTVVNFMLNLKLKRTL